MLVNTLCVLDIDHAKLQIDALRMYKVTGNQKINVPLRSLPLRSLQKWQRWLTTFLDGYGMINLLRYIEK